MSFLMGGGGKKTKPQYTGLQLQTASSVQALSIVWGGNRVGPNLFWYGDFKAHKKKQKAGKGMGGSATTYTYSASVQLGLCEGPISGVGRVFKNEEKFANPAALGMTTFLGTYPQSPWGYLTTAHPSEALNYAGVAYVAVANYDLGQNASLPNHSFEVFGREYDTAPLGHDADCADVIYDFLTNPNCGVLYPVANIDVDQLFSTVDAPTTGDSSYQTYCTAMGFGLSPVLSDPTPAGDTLAKWARLTNSEVIWDGSKLRIIPYCRDTITGNGVTYIPPQLTPQFYATDEDFLTELLGTVTDQADCPNVLSVKINNRNNEYNPLPVEWRDQALIDQFGERKANSIDAPEITDPDIAMTMVTLMGQRGAYVRNEYSFKLGAEFVELAPMDILVTTNAAGSQFTLQITSVEENEDGEFEITAEEISETVAAAGAGAPQPSTPTIINTGVVASPVNPPIILEPAANLTGGVAQIWAAVSGGDGTDFDPYWGGAIVYVSVDDITYQAIGTIDSAARQGKLTSTLAAPAGPYPQAVDFDVDLSMSGGELQGVTTQEAEDGATLSYVGGEILSYTGATLLSQYNYELDDLYRALYGSTGGAHSIGDDFARLDENIFKYNLPAEYIGIPLYFKFQSFNIWNQGYQDLSVCVAYPYTPDGNGFAVAPPSSVGLTFSVNAQADGTNVIRGTITIGASAGPLLSRYDVEFSPDDGVTWVSAPSVPAGGTKSVFEPAIPLTDYKARAKAVSSAVEGIPSNWVTTGTVNSGNLSTVAPGPVSTVAATGGALSVLVTWNPPVTGGAPSGYKIYAVNNHTDPFGSAVLVGTVTGAATLQFTHVGLTADSPWRYWVTAFNFAGESSEDGPADATTTSAGGGGALEIQEAGVTKLAAATVLNFVSGATVVDGGSGEAEISIAGGGGGGGLPQQTMLVQQQVAAGAAPGSSAAFTGAYSARNLNTVVQNSITGASLGSSQVTLPKGTYTFMGYATGYLCNSHKAQLYDTTNGAVLGVGTAAYSRSTSSTDGTSVSIVRGTFTLTAPAVVELRWRTETSSANGQGIGPNFGDVNVSSELFLIREGSSGGEVNGGWEVINSWDGSIDPAVSELVTPNLDAYDDILMVFIGVTMSGSQWRAAQFSTDDGATWYNSGQYIRLNNTGTNSSVDNYIFCHTKAASGSRACHLYFPNIGTVGAKKMMASSRDGYNYVFTPTAPVNRVKAVATAGTFTGGTIVIYGRKKPTKAAPSWTTVASWDFSVDGAVATVESSNLLGYSEVMVEIADVSASASGQRCVQVSLDGGATWENGSNTYEEFGATGVIATNNTFYPMTTANAGARSIVMSIQDIGSNKSPKMANLINRGVAAAFIGSPNPITNVRVLNNTSSTGVPSGTLTGGKVRILAR